MLREKFKSRRWCLEGLLELVGRKLVSILVGLFTLGMLGEFCLNLINGLAWT